MNVATFVLCLLATLCPAQTSPIFDSHQLLLQAAERIQQNTVTLPRLTCTETVERSFHTRPGDKLTWSDRFRLSVGLFQGRELFSWPGEGTFQSAWPDSLVGSGAPTAGELGPFTVNVFLAAGLESFHFHHLVADAAEYSYSVPYEESRFFIKLGSGASTRKTAFEGNFFIDLQSHD